MGKRQLSRRILVLKVFFRWSVTKPSGFPQCRPELFVFQGTADDMATLNLTLCCNHVWYFATATGLLLQWDNTTQHWSYRLQLHSSRRHCHISLRSVYQLIYNNTVYCTPEHIGIRNNIAIGLLSSYVDVSGAHTFTLIRFENTKNKQKDTRYFPVRHRFTSNVLNPGHFWENPLNEPFKLRHTLRDAYPHRPTREYREEIFSAIVTLYIFLSRYFQTLTARLLNHEYYFSGFSSVRTV